ncbi:hypothetical protein NQ315_004467 [Exocentrus adspersus]|uniref:Uncharacterized protein n=1 Tax=Exocentrus adspersus TaxID=1586481 RepID=A0AAV8VQ61_9CUCU|nr:hypothetical protein NQ315_004467 [Exocentrus adspersus]
MNLDLRTNAQLQIKIYRNIKNVKNLKQKLISGELKCCMIKPSLIYDPFQIAVAANKALASAKLITKTIFSEILFNLSVSKHITRSLQTFGIDDNDENILVVTISQNGEDNSESVYSQIDGEEVELSQLKNLSDLDNIKNVYKISEKESLTIPLIDSIVSRIATKDFLSH